MQTLPNEKWSRVVRSLYVGICQEGDLSFDGLLFSLEGRDSRGGRSHSFFEFVAAILYEHECGQNGGIVEATRVDLDRKLGNALNLYSDTSLFSLPSPRRLTKELVEHMLLVDYCIGVFPVHTQDEGDQLDGWKTS